VTSNPTYVITPKRYPSPTHILNASQRMMLAIDPLPLDLARRVTRRGPCRTRCLQKDDSAADRQRIVDAAASGFSRMQRFPAITAQREASKSLPSRKRGTHSVDPAHFIPAQLNGSLRHRPAPEAGGRWPHGARRW
jgi:hypothetical protein